MSTTRQPRRIGIDARLWNETGVGRYIRNLVAGLQKLDRENEYVLFVRSRDVANIMGYITKNNFQVVAADIRWHTLQEQIVFPKILQKERLDLMHFPYFSVPIFYKGPYVLTIHDLILHHFPTGKASTKSWLVYALKQISYRYVIAKAAKNAEKILTVSYATRNEIVQNLHIAPQRVAVTYEGVDVGIQDKRVLLPRGITRKDERYFLYVGNAYPHKNLTTLLESFALLIQSSQSALGEIKLIFVGKEDYFYKRLQKHVVALGLENSIYFRHNVSDTELSDLYTHALALVMPSLMEGFGLPVLEAMAKGCLVAASDIPVFKEIAEDVPLYFNPFDARSMTNVLESIAKGRILDEAERKTRGKIKANKFSWDTMAQQTHAAYEGCLSVRQSK